MPSLERLLPVLDAFGNIGHSGHKEGGKAPVPAWYVLLPAEDRAISRAWAFGTREIWDMRRLPRERDLALTYDGWFISCNFIYVQYSSVSQIFWSYCVLSFEYFFHVTSAQNSISLRYIDGLRWDAFRRHTWKCIISNPRSPLLSHCRRKSQQNLEVCHLPAISVHRMTWTLVLVPYKICSVVAALKFAGNPGKWRWDISPRFWMYWFKWTQRRGTNSLAYLIIRLLHIICCIWLQVWRDVHYLTRLCSFKGREVYLSWWTVG